MSERPKDGPDGAADHRIDWPRRLRPADSAHLGAHFPLLGYDPAVTDAPKGVILRPLAEVAACDAVILATPVPALSAVIAAINPYLRPGAVVLDVGSVKVIPAQKMLAELPPYVDIIGTHPLFGPQSARGGVKGLKIVICPIRGRGARPLAAYLRKTLGSTPSSPPRKRMTARRRWCRASPISSPRYWSRWSPCPATMTTASFDLLITGGGHGAPRCAGSVLRHRAHEPLRAGRAAALFCPGGGTGRQSGKKWRRPGSA